MLKCSTELLSIITFPAAVSMEANNNLKKFNHLNCKSNQKLQCFQSSLLKFNYLHIDPQQHKPENSQIILFISPTARAPALRLSFSLLFYERLKVIPIFILVFFLHQHHLWSLYLCYVHRGCIVWKNMLY